MSRLPIRPRPKCEQMLLDMAKCHRDVSLKIAYSMPKFSAESRRIMRLYALRATGKSL